LTIIQTIFNCLPEKLGKSQQNQPKVQRKRHTPFSNQEDGQNYHGNKDADTPYNSSEHVQKTNLSTDSQVSAWRTDAVDSGESPAPDAPLNPLHFPTFPEMPPHSNFPRFLGPDSIENLFRPELDYSRDFVPPDIDSRVTSWSQKFDSLDQYVSALDMQKGQEYPPDINASSNDENISPYTRPCNATLETGEAGPFIPLSPYLIRAYSHAGNSLVPSEPTGFLTDGYYMVNQNVNPQEAQLQGITNNQEMLWTEPQG
jgi:hypothetical protein